MADVDVVVVGAGFAGLVAARRLQDRGRTVRVLEARDRVGGRTHTEEVAGTWVDLGGQWVGPGQDRFYALAAELGVDTLPQHEHGDALVLRGGEVRGVDDIALAFPDEVLGAYLTAVSELEEIANGVDVAAPWASAGAERWDAMTMATWMSDHVGVGEAADLLTLGIEAVFAAEPANLSVLHCAFYCASAGGWARLTDTGGGAQQDRFVGGVGPIAERLAARVGDAVLLEAPVRAVEHGDEVVVRHDAGAVSGRRAVIAVPPTLAGRIDYRPPLPAMRDQLTQRMPAGSVIKFHVAYDRPWWRDRGFSGQVLAVEELIEVTFDCSPPDESRGIITGFFEGAQAITASGLGIEGRRNHVVEVLTKALGDEAGEPLAYIDRDWSAEPFTRGCYGAHMPPGAWTQLGPALRRPVGVLHWAGTETAERWMGYIDGAIESGERVAEEVHAAL